MKKHSLFKILVTMVTCVIVLATLVIPFSALADDQNNSTLPMQLPAPPDGFNPLTATSDQLVMYGFPQRPTDQESLKNWENVMANAKIYVKPHLKPSNIQHDFYNTNNLAGIGVWGGNNVRNGYTPTYTGCSATWTMPVYSPGYGATHEVASYWTGIGGIKGSTTIVQAGADANRLYRGETPSYVFWVENISGGTDYYNQDVTSLSVNGGDNVYVSVTYGGVNSVAYFLNITTSQYTSVSFSASVYDGTSANFLFENAWPPVPYQHYDNIPTVHFSSSTLYWHDGSGASGGGESTAYNYTNCRQHDQWLIVKAYPQNVTNGTFDIIAHN
jgi:hypothetical protein